MNQKLSAYKSNNSISSFTKLGHTLYLVIGCMVLLSSLCLLSLILIEAISKGRFPIEADSRFLIGIKGDIGFSSFCIMLYGSITWIAFTGIIYKFFKLQKTYFIIGFLGILNSIFLIYLIFYSEIGKWILD